MREPQPPYSSQQDAFALFSISDFHVYLVNWHLFRTLFMQKLNNGYKLVGRLYWTTLRRLFWIFMILPVASFFIVVPAFGGWTVVAIAQGVRISTIANESAFMLGCPVGSSV